MWQLRYWICLLLVALSLAPVQRVAACSCMHSQPQTLFCNSDFVILVKVRNATNPNEHETAYHVKINRIFKVNSRTSYMVLKQNTLYTASSGGMCGVSLKVGEKYVVSGGTYGGDKAHISLCGISMLWRNVSKRQRKDFRHLYHFGCSRKIGYTPWWSKGTFSRMQMAKNGYGNDHVPKSPRGTAASGCKDKEDAPGCHRGLIRTASRSNNRNANDKERENLKLLRFDTRENSMVDQQESMSR